MTAGRPGQWLRKRLSPLPLGGASQALWNAMHCARCKQGLHRIGALIYYESPGGLKYCQRCYWARRQSTEAVRM